MSLEFHVPVMGQEVATHLIHNPDGIYIDGTLGGGGHAEINLSKLSKKGIYIGIDRDSDAIQAAQKRLTGDSRFRCYQATFDNIEYVVNSEQIGKIDGLLLDLGVSSFQIDKDERGFAFRKGLSLDMRMNSDQELNAEWILNNYLETDLRRIFREYGEERFSGRIAYKIIQERKQKPITKTDDLLNIIDRCVNPRFVIKSYARIFQALRIEVNSELDYLKKALEEATKYLSNAARLCVITYHSLEDRIVKNFYKEMENPCECPPELPVCVCGKKPVLKRIKPFFIVAAKDEIKNNPRARSAKMRVAEKV